MKENNTNIKKYDAAYIDALFDNVHLSDNNTQPREEIKQPDKPKYILSQSTMEVIKKREQEYTSKLEKYNRYKDFL